MFHGSGSVLRTLATFLDCYWVGSLDFNFLENQVGLSTKPPKNPTFCRGVNSNQVGDQI